MRLYWRGRKIADHLCELLDTARMLPPVFGGGVWNNCCCSTAGFLHSSKNQVLHPKHLAVQPPAGTSRKASRVYLDKAKVLVIDFSIIDKPQIGDQWRLVVLTYPARATGNMEDSVPMIIASRQYKVTLHNTGLIALYPLQGYGSGTL